MHVQDSALTFRCFSYLLIDDIFRILKFARFEPPETSTFVPVYNLEVSAADHAKKYFPQIFWDSSVTTEKNMDQIEKKVEESEFTFEFRNQSSYELTSDRIQSTNANASW